MIYNIYMLDKIPTTNSLIQAHRSSIYFFLFLFPLIKAKLLFKIIVCNTYTIALSYHAFSLEIPCL